MAAPPLPPLDDNEAWAALADDIIADQSDWRACTAAQHDPYSILNVARSSSTHDVRSRYRQMSLLFHPDRRATSASAIFPVVSSASTTLSEPGERVAFDLLGAVPGLNHRQTCDAYLETLLSRHELEHRIAEFAIQAERQRRQRRARCYLDGTVGPSSAATESQCQLQIDAGAGVDTFGVASALSCSPKTRPLSTLQLFWSHTFGSWTSSKVAVSVANAAPGIELIGNRTLSSTTTASIGIGLRARLRHALSLWFRAAHSFTTSTTGSLTLTLAPMPSLSLSLSDRRRPVKRRHRGFEARSGGLRLSGLHSGLESKLVYRLSRHYHVFVDAHGFLIDTSLEVGVRRRYAATGVTTSCSLLLSEEGGVVVHVGLGCGPCRLKLPVPLSVGDDMVGWRWHCVLLLPLLLHAALTWSAGSPELSLRGLEALRAHRETLAWQRQHRDEAERISMQEEDENGLVILEAVYGDLSWAERDVAASADDGASDDDNEDGDADLEERFPAVIDARIPLQAHVRHGELHVPGPVAALPGLYAVRPGPHCRLRVYYRFDCVDHVVVVADDEGLGLPDLRHIVGRRGQSPPPLI